MTIATGTIQYQLGTTPVTGCGFSYSDAKLTTSLVSFFYARRMEGVL